MGTPPPPPHAPFLFGRAFLLSFLSPEALPPSPALPCTLCFCPWAQLFPWHTHTHPASPHHGPCGPRKRTKMWHPYVYLLSPTYKKPERRRVPQCTQENSATEDQRPVGGAKRREGPECDNQKEGGQRQRVPPPRRPYAPADNIRSIFSSGKLLLTLSASPKAAAPLSVIRFAATVANEFSVAQNTGVCGVWGVTLPQPSIRRCSPRS